MLLAWLLLTLLSFEQLAVVVSLVTATIIAIAILEEVIL